MLLGAGIFIPRLSSTACKDIFPIPSSVGSRPAMRTMRWNQVVADMIELLDAIGAERALWVGHDWGSPAVWSIAHVEK